MPIAGIVVAALAGLAAGLLFGVLVAARRGLGPADRSVVPATAGSLPHPALDALAGATGDGLLTFDADARVAHASREAECLLDLPEGTANGRTAAEALRDRATVAALQEALSSRTPQTAPLSSPSGAHQLVATAVPLEGFGDWAALVLLRDVTEARRAETVRQDFVSNVSHELRTPLASIKAVVEVLQGGVEDPQERTEFLRGIDEETDRMIHLVEELMELTRMEAGQIELRREPVDLDALLDDVAKRMRPQASQKGLRLDIESNGGALTVRGDRERLARALLNLVQNAVNFTPAGGSVALRSLRVDGRARIEVEDSGVGIPAEHRDRIFERFYKVDRSRGSGGSGLGLAIVKHTVEAHGGTVTVRSRLGEGATFAVELPLDYAGAAVEGRSV